jgi:hypothetical protein
MAFLDKVVRGSIIFSYALIALEIIIMVSPFAFYFYSIYGPFLKGLYAFPPTRWLTAFVLPHILLSLGPSTCTGQSFSERALRPRACTHL